MTGTSPRRRRVKVADTKQPNPREAFRQSVVEYDAARAHYFARCEPGGEFYDETGAVNELAENEAIDRFNGAIDAVLKAVLAIHSRKGEGEHGRYACRMPPCSVRHGSRLFVAGGDSHTMDGYLVLTIIDDADHIQLEPTLKGGAS